MLQTQLKLMKALTHRIENLTTTPSSPDISSDVLLRSMTNFLHDPQSGIVFESYEDMFIVDLRDKDDRTKVRLLL